jgi:phage gpG-like protein
VGDGFRGDMRGLEDLRRRVASIADGNVRMNVNHVCAQAAMKLIDDGFRTSTDPYGRPWTPLKSRVGKPLLDTRTHLQNRLTPHLMPSGFTIDIAFAGAAVHQYGAVIKPKNAKALAFRTRGAPTKRSPRGKLNPVAFAQKVTIPQRQYMPEGDVGPRWGKGIGDAADEAIRLAVGHP